MRDYKVYHNLSYPKPQSVWFQTYDEHGKDTQISPAYEFETLGTKGVDIIDSIL